LDFFIYKKKKKKKKKSKKTYRHIALTSNMRLGHGLDQLTRDSKIAKFYLSLRVDQYVGGLDIW